MYKITTLALLAAVFTACNSGDTKTGEAKNDSASAASQVPASDWISLFDGKTLSGWHQYGGGAINNWKAADGVLYIDSTTLKKRGDAGGGDLVSDEEYDNFDLQLEWKITAGGNSGVIFYSHEDTVKYKHPYETGLEMQILDNAGHNDGKIAKHHAGDLYDLVACSKETVKPVGGWNQAEIKSKNGKLDLYLNGENVVSTTMWDANWDQLVAGSKFKGWEGFGKYKKGHIVLQNHGYMVSFRNILVKKL